MACEKFSCVNKNSKDECEHQNKFTTYCLGMKCEGHSLCCMCKTDCENNKSHLTKAF